MGLIYTQIQHLFRKENGLSNNEYVLMDMIHILSTMSNSKFPGWCYMKREKIAEEIGITRQGLAKMIIRLEMSELLIVDYESRFMKTTAKWQKVYFDKSDSLHDVNKVTKDVNLVADDVNKVAETCKQSLHHDNNSYNNSNNIVDDDKRKNKNPPPTTNYGESTLLEMPIIDCIKIYLEDSKYSRSRELLAMSKFLTPETLNVWVYVFERFLLKRGDVSKTLKDFIKHLADWLKLVDTTKEPLIWEKEQNNKFKPVEPPKKSSVLSQKILEKLNPNN